jgi:nitrite reductase (NADH) small subunit
MSGGREVRVPLRDAPAEGDVLMLEIGRHRVGLFRVAGAFHALADRCPHRGAPLCAGRIATPIEARDGGLALGAPGSVLRCPWHKWEFEIATGRCLVDERVHVRAYDVRLEDDEVVVALDRSGPGGLSTGPLVGGRSAAAPPKRGRQA